MKIIMVLVLFLLVRILKSKILNTYVVVKKT